MKKTHIGATIKIVAVAALALAALPGCSSHGSDNRTVEQPTGPATVVKFPYGFRNVAAKCEGPNMVYSGSAGTDDKLPPSIAVVPNDPRCK